MAVPPIIPGSTVDTPVDDNGVVHSAAEQSIGTGHSSTMDGGSAATDQVLGRDLREKQPSVLLRDFVSYAMSSMSPISVLPSPSAFPAAVHAGVEPRSFTEAMQDPGWREAMTKEICALEDHGTWVLSALPPDKRALGCKWVYKIKYHSDGSVERLKARLVILGSHQVTGLD